MSFTSNLPWRNYGMVPNAKYTSAGLATTGAAAPEWYVMGTAPEHQLENPIRARGQGPDLLVPGCVVDRW
jgi:hypothetical protein